MRAGPLLFLAAAAVAVCGTEPGPAGWEASAGGGGGLLGGGPDLAALAATTDFHSGSWAIAGALTPHPPILPLDHFWAAIHSVVSYPSRCSPQPQWRNTG